jgi:hypothetical protein
VQKNYQKKYHIFTLQGVALHHEVPGPALADLSRSGAVQTNYKINYQMFTLHGVASHQQVSGPALADLSRSGVRCKRVIKRIIKFSPSTA